jgi:hypothetical protein
VGKFGGVLKCEGIAVWVQGGARPLVMSHELAGYAEGKRLLWFGEKFCLNWVR